MRNVKFWATGVVVLLCMTMMTSCKYRYIEKPDQLLTHEQMVDIICEVAYVEALESRGAFIHDSTSQWNNPFHPSNGIRRTDGIESSAWL